MCKRNEAVGVGLVCACCCLLSAVCWRRLAGWWLYDVLEGIDPSIRTLGGRSGGGGGAGLGDSSQI